MINNISANNLKKIFSVTLTAILVVSGFFVAYNAFAVHTATVDMTIKKLSGETIDAIDINQTVNVEIAVTKTTGSSLGAIKIFYPADFSAPNFITCPATFTSSEINAPGKYVKCAMGQTGTAINSGTVILNSIQATVSLGEKTFSVETSDVDYDKETINKSITVKNLSASATVGPLTTDVEQSRNYNFTITNNGGAGSDSITALSMNVPETFTGVTMDANPAGWSCNYTAPTVTCTASGAGIADTQSVIVPLTAIAPATVVASSWSVTVTGSLGGSAVPASQPQITVQTLPSIQISGAISPAKVSQGQTGVAYTVPVKNSGDANVVLDTGSTISFSDRAKTYSAVLSAATSISGNNGTANLVFSAANIDAVMTAQSYIPTLNLSGTDSNTATFTQSTTDNPITVQTPANLVVAQTMSVNIPAISKNSSIKTTTISLNVQNSGQANAVLTNEATALVLKDSVANPITAQFSITLSAVGTISGDETKTITYQITAGVSTVYEGPVTAEVSLVYSDVNTGQPVSPITDSKSGLFIVDNIVPSITNATIAPASGPTNINTPTISFKIADTGSNVNVSTVKVSNGAADYTATCTTLPDCFVTLPAQADGTYTFTILAADNAGNVATSQVVTGYVIDTQAPTIGTVNVTYPDGQTKAKNGDTVTISVNITDSASGVGVVTLNASNIGGTGASNITMTKGTGDTYLTQVTVSGTSGDSSQTITITAKDAVNNTATQNGTVAIDNTLPQVSSYTLNGNAASIAFNPSKPASVSIVVNASEEVKFTEIRILNSLKNTVKSFDQLSYNTTVTETWDGTGNTGDGVYTIKPRMIDRAENVKDEELLSYTITVDTVVPVVNITSPQENKVVVGSLPITASVTGADSCAYSFDGGLNKTTIACNAPSISISGEGHQTLTFYGRDNAGNEAFDTINFIANNDKKLTVGTGEDFATIQEAIANSQVGDTIFIKNGHYDLTSTLNLTKKLTIEGGSQAGVVIDASAVSGYGIEVTSGDVALSKFTLIGPSSHTNGYGIHSSGVSNLNYSNLVVNNSGRTGIDFIGCNSVVVDIVTLTSNGGAGLAITDSKNVTVGNITTSGNVWAGMAVYTSGQYYTGGSDNIKLQGTNSFSEPIPFYTETDHFSGGTDFAITNLNVSNNFHYIVRLPASGPHKTGFYPDLSSALTVAASAVTQGATDAVVNEVITETPLTDYHNYYVGPGMKIQSVINAAVNGDTVNVAAGTYNESVLIEKKLTLVGSGETKPVITGLAPANYIVKINGASANGTVINNLEINGGGTGTNSNGFDYGILVNNSGSDSDSNRVEIKNSTVKNIWKNSSNGIGVESSSYVLVHNNVISSFHKRGIRFINSEGKVYNNEVVGESVDGTTRVQNLVNLWGGSTVEIYSNTLHDAKSLSGTSTWDSPGIFVSSYGGSGASHANIHDNEIYNGDTGIVVGSTYAATDNSSATISNNNLYNLNWAINFEKSTVSATITKNKFSNNVKAINDDVNGSHVAPANVTAEMNWWGAATGPATDMIFAGVDYRPWCTEIICIAIDNTPLTVIITPAATSPTKISPIPVTVTFSKAVYDFTKDDITVTNGAVTGDVTISPTDPKVYTFNVTPGDQGSVSVDIPAEKVWDTSGNYNTQSNTLSIVYDPGVPSGYSVTINQPKINISNVTVLSFTFTGAEVGTTYNYTISNGAQSVSNSGTITSATQQITGIDVSSLSDGTLTLSVTLTDAAQNTGALATDTVNKDTIAPTFTINDGTEAGPVKTDTIKITVTEVNSDTSEYGFSADNICNASDTYGIGFVSDVNFTIAGDHTDYLCVKATDSFDNTTYQLVGQLNTDNINPTLTLGSLFTGQTLTGGRVYPINWTAADLNFSGTPVKLEYSIDVNDGATWYVIIDSTENDDGVYSWSVPTQINSSAAKIKITATDLADNSTSAQSNVFTIAYSESVDNAPPVVTLNSPNGGESWQGGSSHVITWTATDNVTPAGSIAVKLEYSTDGSANWTTIIDSAENDGAYLWTVPDSTSTNALVKATVTDAASNSGSDLSNAVFTITVQPPAQICTNAGGGQWTCSISLNAGWNLVSLPVIVSDTAISHVLSGISANVDTVQYWDSLTSVWKTYHPAGEVGDLATIADGKGYWMFMNNPATLTITGTKAPAAPAHSPVYNVFQEWNLIGFKSTISQLAQTYLQTLTAGSYTLLNASNENKNNGSMDSGRGYWLWMSNAGSIVTYSETE
jgi:hypothetical protein